MYPVFFGLNYKYRRAHYSPDKVDVQNVGMGDRHGYFGTVKTTHSDEQKTTTYIIDKVVRYETVHENVREEVVNHLNAVETASKITTGVSVFSIVGGILAGCSGYGLVGALLFGTGVIGAGFGAYRWGDVSDEQIKWRNQLHHHVSIRRLIPVKRSDYVFTNRLIGKYLMQAEATRIWHMDVAMEKQRPALKLSSTLEDKTKEVKRFVIASPLRPAMIHYFESYEKIGKTSQLVGEVDAIISEYTKFTDEYNDYLKMVQSSIRGDTAVVDRQYDANAHNINALHTIGTVSNRMNGNDGLSAVGVINDVVSQQAISQNERRRAAETVKVHQSYNDKRVRRTLEYYTDCSLLLPRIVDIYAKY